ncbi:hypothetical protein, partial [Klebsiella pneumoniae]|uniref:hypothetical protein n=1 Tax=Klebsiella pneumoniae TaxID=573 RepID=UPI001C8F37B4
ILLFKTINLVLRINDIHIAKTIKTQLQTNATKYFGAALEGYKYELHIDVELDKQFISESAIALFNGGLGTQFDIHDKMVVNEQYNEGIIKQIA